jgi:tetratricopeptide (TPR) repeat protein
MHRPRFVFLLALFFITVFSGSASAQTVTPPPANPLDQARAAITAGRLEDAKKILNSVPESKVDIDDLDFLRGTLASDCGDYDTAIIYFRAILARNPSLNRVRLDLARTFFLAGDDAVAEYHFHLAEAAGLPPAVQANVDKILNEIKRRKKWTADASFGLEPSTNINTATSAQTVDLYGTPYQLSQAAQKTSGVGVVGALSGSYQFDLTPDSRLVAGSSLNGTDFIQKDFDDNSANAFIGPRFLIGQSSEATVEATATQRWYGGQDYYTGGGGRVEGKTTVSPRLQLDGAVAVQQLNYTPAYAAYTGPVTTLSTGATYGLDSASFVRLDGAVIHEQTAELPFRDTQYYIGPNYYRELPHGFIGNIGFNADFAYFDALLPIFGVTRHDTTLNYQIGVSNRTVNLFGFMPVVTYIHTDRYSDIPLYAFTSDRVILGATQNF